MKGTLVDMIMRRVRQAARLHHRLVVVFAPFGEGKTHALCAIAAQTGAPMLDLHPVLSDRMRGLGESGGNSSFPVFWGRLLAELRATWSCWMVARLSSTLRACTTL